MTDRFMAATKLRKGGIMPAAMITTQAETRKKLRHFQRSQDQRLKMMAVSQGRSSLAKALMVRLRRKRALALRQPLRAAQSASTRSRLHTPFPRVQRDTKQVKQILDTVVQGSEAERWLAAPNAMLGGARPVDKIRQGKTRQVIEILALVQEGIYA